MVGTCRWDGVEGWCGEQMGWCGEGWCVGGGVGRVVGTCRWNGGREGGVVVEGGIGHLVGGEESVNIWIVDN